MVRRIRNLISKELIQFRRDRVLTLFILLVPTLQFILMTRSVERGVNQQPVVILDFDRSRLSRQLITALDNTEELRVQFQVDSPEALRHLLDKGQARLAVVIPAGFAREIGQAHTTQQVQLIADATNTVVASTVMGAASGAISRFSAGLANDIGLVVPEFIDFRTDVRFNPSLDYRDYSLPAMLGFITYQVTLAVAALGLARERELGTLEQLMVSPLRRFELTLGKGIPAAAIGGLNFVVIWAISLTVFDVPMNGSPALLAILTLPFITAVVGWGLVISAISRTQQQAILLVFIQAMVEITLSGFLVSVENMPPLLQTISHFVPLQHYLVIIRSVMLKGSGFSDLWVHVLALVALSLVMGLIALRSVARRLE